MTNCVDCPDGQNYAAIALQLQETALQAEECLYAAETALRRVWNPHTFLYTHTNSPSYSANIFNTLSGTEATIFANGVQDNINTNPWVPGVWTVGAHLTATATGAINDNTYREVGIVVLPSYVTLPLTTLNVAVFVAAVTVYEPNNGTGVDISAHSTVTVGVDEKVIVYFRHGNVGSTLNIAAGATYWATRLSDASALRVV